MEIHFAPLQGYTDNAYRRLHAQLCGGVDTYYTPFIRWEKGDVRGKDIVDILPERNEGIHLIPQIICADPGDFNRLCDIIQEHGYQEIDLNMGCPAPMQTKLKRGSGILPHPDNVERLCQEMTRRQDVRFSAKMRLGLDDKEQWRPLLPILNDAPLQHITLHPRIATQMYKGEVDMPAFGEFASLVRHPLIYNGDILAPGDIQRIATSFPTLKGIMIGRGLLARPPSPPSTGRERNGRKAGAGRHCWTCTRRCSTTAPRSIRWTLRSCSTSTPSGNTRKASSAERPGRKS